MSQKNEATAPVSRIFDLSDLTQAGSVVDFAASSEELIRLAHWMDVVAVHTFGAKLTLRKLPNWRFSLEAELNARIEQRCVVTLEPISSDIHKHFMRELHFIEYPVETEGELTLAAGDDEAPDTINDMHYDYCAPLLEEMLLDIDPYPRKADASFTPPAEMQEKSDSPFAVLAALKDAANKP